MTSRLDAAYTWMRSLLYIVLWSAISAKFSFWNFMAGYLQATYNFDGAWLRRLLDEHDFHWSTAQGEGIPKWAPQIDLPVPSLRPLPVRLQLIVFDLAGSNDPKYKQNALTSSTLGYQKRRHSHLQHRHLSRSSTHCLLSDFILMPMYFGFIRNVSWTRNLLDYILTACTR